MRKRAVFIPIGALLFTATAYTLGWSTLFTVSSVEIKGTNSILPTSIKLGQRLARVQPRAIASEFEKLDWVKNANVSRNWINGKVIITLTERVPIAIYNNRAIDGGGFSFILRDQDTAGLPHIQAPNVESAITAAIFFHALPAEITDAVVLVKVRSGDDYVLEINQGSRIVELLWGQDVENLLKVKVYSALIAQPENVLVKRIDISAPRTPIVK